MSNKVANALKSTGVILGDKVALYCINSPWFVVAYYGILKVGVTVVPINLLLNVNEISKSRNKSQNQGKLEPQNPVADCA